MLPWSCRMTGDCCRITKALLMTTDEKALLLSAVPAEKAETLIWWTDPANPGFHYLKLAPCPLLAEDGKCTVHEVRPYNCRRFSCYRVGDEPYEAGPDNLCNNLADRLITSRSIRRDYQLRQRKAQRWARAHGWRDEP